MNWKPIETCPRVEDERILLYLPKQDVVVSGCWHRFSGEREGPHVFYEDFYDWSTDNDLIILDDPGEGPSHWCELEIPEVGESDAG